MLLRCCLAWVLVFGLQMAASAQGAIPFRKHLADYDAELRGADRRVDTDAMLQRLSSLGVTTYYWLVWHQKTDWEDLKLFLPKANRAKINVWVYLVPPSEGPANGYPASEPFQLDYQRWAEEIARLSLQHTNLTAWVIDDFYANRKFFTPTYVHAMQAKAKNINPRLLFLPLMYFPEITPEFLDEYRQKIDGVVVAYPSDREEILDARRILKGESTGPRAQFSCPSGTATQPGDFVAAAINARITDPKKVHLSFEELDDFIGSTSAYHFKQVLVDGAVVWEADAAGGSNRWQEVRLDLTSQATGRTNLVIGFRLFDKKGVGNFGLRWRLRDLRAEGLTPSATLKEPETWQVEKRGPFTAGFGRNLTATKSRFYVPFIVMTAADAGEFRLRHGEPTTPNRIADGLRMCLELLEQNQCDGVVTYCLDKRMESTVYPLAKELFGRAGR